MNRGLANRGLPRRCWNACQRTAHALALLLLAAAYRQRIVSDHRPDGARSRIRARRHAQAKLDKLDALLAQSFTSPQDATLFAEMLSLPNDGRYPALELTPQQRRQKTLEALAAQMEALSRQNPVLMIFEDAHWVDPTSLEAFGRAVDRIRTLGVLLIVTYRPEFEPPWIGRPHVTALTINRLGEREIAAIIDRVIGNKLLPASVRQDIIERTDGIPLFVEEMTKAVLEAESEGAARQTAAAVPSAALAVPASLHASLMARLDRLGPAKEVAQIGAAIGREFSHALLGAVAGKPERSWDRRLIVSLLLVWSSGRAFRLRRTIYSSTLSCRMRLTALCSANLDARSTLVSLKRWKANSPRLPRTSRHCLRVISPKPG